jgi:hypothetical protein
MGERQHGTARATLRLSPEPLESLGIDGAAMHTAVLVGRLLNRLAAPPASAQSHRRQATLNRVSHTHLHESGQSTTAVWSAVNTRFQVCKEQVCEESTDQCAGCKRQRCAHCGQPASAHLTSFSALVGKLFAKSTCDDLPAHTVVVSDGGRSVGGSAPVRSGPRGFRNIARTGCDIRRMHVDNPMARKDAHARRRGRTALLRAKRVPPPADVGASGIEPETSAMSTLRSYQLSYAPAHLRRSGRDDTATGPRRRAATGSCLPHPAGRVGPLLFSQGLAAPRWRGQAALTSPCRCARAAVGRVGKLRPGCPRRRRGGGRGSWPGCEPVSGRRS